MSEIIIEQRIQAEEDQTEISVFTPNPLEFESLADHQDVTFSFTDFPFDQSTIDSTTDFTTTDTAGFTTEFTTEFTTKFATEFTNEFATEFINDEMTFSPILPTDHETSLATKIQTSNDHSKSPTSTTSWKSATSGVITSGVRTTASYVLSAVTTTMTITPAIKTQIPVVEIIPVTGSSVSILTPSVSTTTFQTTISSAITTKTTTSTTLQPVTSVASPTTSSVYTSITRASITTSTKYSRKDACINFCQGTGHHKL